MQLNPAHIAFIRQDVRKRGIILADLSDSLVDHICCALENDPCTDFHASYARALESFGTNGLKEIQNETLLLINLKKEITMKKTMFVLGYLAAMLITSGLLFKLQHWNGASIMLVLGIAVLNLGFLPMYFYDRYKRAINSGSPA